MAIQQGMAGVTSLAGQLAQAAPLYSKTDSARAFNQLDRRFQNTTGQSSQQFMSGVSPETLPLNNAQKTILKEAGGSIGNMSQAQYTDFMGQFTPDYLGGLEATMGLYREAATGDAGQLRYYEPSDTRSKYYQRFSNLPTISTDFNFFDYTTK